MSKLKKNSNKGTDFLNISNDDFESPIVFKKFKSSSDKPPQRTRKQKKPKEKQLTLHQVYEENFSYSDVNSEHLQLALALSRSTSEMYNSTTKEEFPLSTQNEGRKKTLLEFGFKTTRPKCSVENKISRKEPLKTNKKSKFRYITPILMMRTEEERESLIQSKLSSIITQNAIVPPEYKHSMPEASSGELEKLICRECCIFNFNKKVITSEAQFIVSSLNIERTRTKKNSLLRDWKKIPLRDHTPERLGKETSSLDGYPDNIENNHFEFSKPSSAENKFSNDEISRVNMQLKNSDIVITPDFTQSKQNEERDGSVSPDLFENSASFSENQVCPILFDNSGDAIFTEKDVPDGNLPEKSITNISNCEENCNPFTDGKSETFSDELTLKEENIMPPSLLEHEFEEKASLFSVIDNNQRAKRRSQELSEAENSSPMDEYIVLSSDEDISLSENSVLNSFSKVDNSISVTPEKPITSDERSNGNSEKLSYEIDEDIPLRNEGDFIENDSLLKDLSFEANIFEREKRTSGSSSENHIRIKPENKYCLDDEKVEIPSNFLSKSTKLNVEANISIMDFNRDNLELNNSFEGHNDSNLVQIKLLNSFSDCDLTKMNEFHIEKNSSNKNDFSVCSNSSNETFSLKLDTKDGEHFENIEFEMSNNSLSNNSLDLDDQNISKMNLSDAFNNTDTKEKSNLELNFSLHDHDTGNEESNIVGEEGNTTEMLSDSLLIKILEDNNCSYSKNNENESKRNSLTSNIEEKYSWFDVSNIDNQDVKFQDISSSSGHESIGKESEVVKEIYNPEKLSGKPTMDNLSVENSEFSFSNNQVNTPLRKSTKTSNIYFKKYASFCEKETPKSSTFTRHKSESNITPNRKFVVKTDNVTPMVDYSTFSTPEIVQELGKFGLKPLKRKRGINLLKHIYETTHPIVDMRQSDADDAPSVKKRRSDDIDKLSTLQETNMPEVLQTWSGTVSESDAILERQRSSKIFSCQVPLQIVWHNFLNKNPEILRNVLLYEPLQVEVIHKMLKDIGYKFHLQDLITFLDQKCITIRIAQNQRNKIA